jgi:hypothetical protein
METCQYCGWGPEICDGELTLDVDPFAVEIYDDYTEVWLCEGDRDQRAMDI